MDDWGKTLAESKILTNEEKVEILAAFFEGFTRQDQALGYTRAYHGFIRALPEGLETLGRELPFDFYQTLKKSKFATIAQQEREEFEEGFKKKLEGHICPLTNLSF